jgi:hypothetical protein
MTIVDPFKNFPKAHSFHMEAYKKGSATEVLPLPSVHDAIIDQGKKSATISLTLENLEPGRRYTMNLTAFNKSDNNALWMLQ